MNGEHIVDPSCDEIDIYYINQGKEFKTKAKFWFNIKNSGLSKNKI